MTWLAWVFLLGNILQALGLMLILKAHFRDAAQLHKLSREILDAIEARQIQSSHRFEHQNRNGGWEAAEASRRNRFVDLP